MQDEDVKNSTPNLAANNDKIKQTIKEQKKYQPGFNKSTWQFADITGHPLQKVLLGYMNWLTKFGKHRVSVWKNKDGWGVVYKVMANVKDEFCQANGMKARSGKYTHMQLKWNWAYGRLNPSKGFEQFEIPIIGKVWDEFKALVQQKLGKIEQQQIKKKFEKKDDN